MKICFSCDSVFSSEDWNCTNCRKSPLHFGDHYSFAPELAKENQFFPAEGFAHLALLEARNFWFRARNNLILWALQHYFPQIKNFLEIGCGTGFVLDGVSQQFPQIKLFGSEIHSAGLQYAAERLPQAELFQMDARRIPFKEEFDVIGAFDILEHIQEDREALAQMYQAVKPGGGAIITVPQHPFLWSEIDEYSCHFRRYTREELLEKIAQAGFSTVRITSFVSFLLPLMYLARLRNKNKLDDDLSSELKIKEPLNTILKSILNLEVFLIRKGVNFPVGGSLLVVAVKK